MAGKKEMSQVERERQRDQNKEVWTATASDRLLLQSPISCCCCGSSLIGLIEQLNAFDENEYIAGYQVLYCRLSLEPPLPKQSLPAGTVNQCKAAGVLERPQRELSEPLTRIKNVFCGLTDTFCHTNRCYGWQTSCRGKEVTRKVNLTLR